MKHPIDSVKWLGIELVEPNDYNPNSQASPNHALLVHSIRTDGFTQPIVVRPPNAEGIHLIVDGEHRWRAAKALKYDRVPTVQLPKSEAECMAATVRHNRAKGSHDIESMASLVRSLRANGAVTEDIIEDLGMTALELERLETSEELFLAIMSGNDQMM